MNALNEHELIACCGMNCGLCMAHQREKNNCPGCRANDTNKLVTRDGCKIKNCKTLNSSKLTFCYECPDFPCINLKKLDKRYRSKYHMSMVENQQSIHDHGIHEFFLKESVRWACPSCGSLVCVHKHMCLQCGHPLDRVLQK